MEIGPVSNPSVERHVYRSLHFEPVVALDIVPPNTFKSYFTQIRIGMSRVILSSLVLFSYPVRQRADEGQRTNSELVH